MDPLIGFGESHYDILSTATYVTSWQQKDLDKKLTRVATAATDHRREETILKQLERHTEVITQTLLEVMSIQNAVLQAYQKDRDTDQKRKAAGHDITEGIANLARKQAEYKTRRCVLDEDFDAREAAQGS